MNEKEYQTSHTFAGVPQYMQYLNNVDETPDALTWCLPKLYKTDVHGNIREWSIGFDGVEFLMMSHGIVNENDTSSIRTDCSKIELNNSGRNILEQALLDARSRHNYKCNHGYAELTQQNEIRTLSPMLANKYDPNKNVIKDKEEVVVNPKLDGIRMLALFSRGKIHKYSRGGIKRVNLKHFDKDLQSLARLLGDVTFDGEIFNLNMNYTQIQSLAQSGWLEGKEHLGKDDAEQLEYWIYDIHFQTYPMLDYRQRWTLLHDLYYKTFTGRTDMKVLLCPQNHAASKADIQYCHQAYIAAGYEGTIIRKLNVPYKEGRSNNLLKYKDYLTDEGIVIDICSGSGTQDGVGYLVLQDRFGNVFNCNYRTDINSKRAWLVDKSTMLGKIVTFKFQDYQKESKVPRFPVGISIRTVL
jgi:hypothetical protein